MKYRPLEVSTQEKSFQYAPGNLEPVPSLGFLPEQDNPAPADADAEPQTIGPENQERKARGHPKTKSHVLQVCLRTTRH